MGFDSATLRQDLFPKRGTPKHNYPVPRTGGKAEVRQQQPPSAAPDTCRPSWGCPAGAALGVRARTQSPETWLRSPAHRTRRVRGQEVRVSRPEGFAFLDNMDRSFALSDFTDQPCQERRPDVAGIDRDEGAEGYHSTRFPRPPERLPALRRPPLGTRRSLLGSRRRTRRGPGRRWTLPTQYLTGMVESRSRRCTWGGGYPG